MHWALLIPIVVGVFSVLQAALNREMAREWGLAGTVLLNSLVFMVAGGAFFAAARAWPSSMPELMRDKGAFASFAWWFVLPGLFGFALVVGLPFAMSKIGAYKLFVVLIAAQLLTSLLWDALAVGARLSIQNILGGVLLLAGVVLVTLRG